MIRAPEAQTTNDQDGTVVVQPDDTLLGVLERLSTEAERSGVVRLVVPIDSPLLLTAREFRALKDASDEQRFAVVLKTADPLRLQLAERTGIRAEALPRARPPATQSSATPVLPSSPPRDATPRADVDWPGPAPVREPEPKIDPAAVWPSRQAESTSNATDEDEDHDEVLEPEGERNPPRRWLPIVAALVVLVAVAYFGIRYLVPSAVVTVVPRSAPAADAIVFDVTADGRKLDDAAAFAVQAVPHRIDVVWEGSVPTTGIRIEPDAVAEGSVELRNPTNEAVVVEAGTEVRTETGVAFAFIEDVSVPGADPVTGKPGAASATVRAVEGGSNGNIEIGQLGGKLPNGVYYSNRMAPTSGGTDKEFPVVAESDLQTLSASAKEAAVQLATAEISKVDPNQMILPTTVNIATQTDEFDAEAGADAATVSVRSTLTLEFLTYDGAAARAQYEPLLIERLQSVAPAGYVIDPGAVTFDTPTASSYENGARVGVAAQTLAMAELNEAERRDLAVRLAGVDLDRAAEILKATSEIESFEVHYQPSWLINQMPNNPERIQFEVVP